MHPPARDEPADYRRAIDDVVAALEGPARARAMRVVDTVRRLVAMLNRCDEELRALAVGGSAAETDRLAAQLGALEGAPHGDDETRELAELLRAQLAVVQRMRVRCEMLSARRTRLLQLLHGVWNLMAALGGLAPGEVDEQLGQVEAVRAEMEEELEALGAAAARDGAGTTRRR